MISTRVIRGPEGIKGQGCVGRTNGREFGIVLYSESQFLGIQTAPLLDWLILSGRPFSTLLKFA